MDVCCGRFLGLCAVCHVCISICWLGLRGVGCLRGWVGVVATRLGWVCACRLVFRASCAILGAGCFGVTCLLLGRSSVAGSVWRLHVVA